MSIEKIIIFLNTFRHSRLTLPTDLVDVKMSIEKVNIFIGQCYSISVCLLESDWLVGWRLFLYGDWLFSLVVDFQLCSILVDAS